MNNNLKSIKLAHFICMEFMIQEIRKELDMENDIYIIRESAKMKLKEGLLDRYTYDTMIFVLDNYNNIKQEIKLANNRYR